MAVQYVAKGQLRKFGLHSLHRPKVARELRRLGGPRQHRDLGEHDFRAIDIQPNLPQGTLDITGCEADGIWIVDDAVEKVPGSKWRTLMAVVDLKIMYENESARRQGSEGALRQDGHVIRADSAPKARASASAFALAAGQTISDSPTSRIGSPAPPAASAAPTSGPAGKVPLRDQIAACRWALIGGVACFGWHFVI